MSGRHILHGSLPPCVRASIACSRLTGPVGGAAFEAEALVHGDGPLAAEVEDPVGRWRLRPVDRRFGEALLLDPQPAIRLGDLLLLDTAQEAEKLQTGYRQFIAHAFDCRFRGRHSLPSRPERGPAPPDGAAGATALTAGRSASVGGDAAGPAGTVLAVPWNGQARTVCPLRGSARGDTVLPDGKGCEASGVRPPYWRVSGLYAQGKSGTSPLKALQCGTMCGCRAGKGRALHRDPHPHCSAIPSIVP